MNDVRKAAGVALLSGLLLACAQQTQRRVAAIPNQESIGVVYQFDAGIEQATRGLRTIHNHLAADPSARITVVAIGDGVDFLLRDAKTLGNYPFNLIVEDLQAAGVRFEACNNTLQTRDIRPGRLLDGVALVPSGMAEISRLQVREHNAYIKP